MIQPILYFVLGIVLGTVLSFIACISWAIWAMAPQRDWEAGEYNARAHQDLYP